MHKPLRGISDIRRFFHRTKRPIFFISATNFNLLGMDEWVRGFKYISYIDCYDGQHPNVFVHSEIPHPEFESIEDINNYLLEHKEVIDYINSQGSQPVAVFLMFNEQTEAICRELGIDIWFPQAALRSRCDNKMETVRIGNAAGVPSVPNALAKVESYDHLCAIAKEHNLSNDLVIQTAFGDSGHTTFFISTVTPRIVSFGSKPSPWTPPRFSRPPIDCLAPFSAPPQGAFFSAPLDFAVVAVPPI